ncbi:EAL domain-containing protein [Bacillus sp. FJAT-42315]|uniref:EAL domain-containing protein n=1 Tax=Bacillus sp. FJAT-42315 TaxID=2014077 RepID=UPI000C2302CD|nr:EAL-associated domain-containing protein [Bacillus sp. FJAT-42315]
MDALEIMSQLDHVTPFFQPIFSADEHKIIGYEVLGRFLIGNEARSLGPFFHDQEVPDEYLIEVEDLILKKALSLYLNSGIQAKLFINRNARLLKDDYGEHLLIILQEYEEKGLRLSDIVLEISESEYSKELEHVLRYYKTFGIQIAIDHIGERSGDVYKYTGYAPNILKVSLQALRKNSSGQTYKDILYSISMLARKIGASLLFESIEMEYQLQYAWKHGGRYYQGYYLQEPCAHFLQEDIQKETLKRKCQEFILHEKRSLEKVYLLAESIQTALQDVVSKYTKQAIAKEQLLVEIGEKFEDMCFRIYICDENGFELTSNYFKKEGSWIFQPEYLGKNWSWRPYFLENILRMRKNRVGLISDLYSDIEKGETIRTFSYALNEREYLFMDISYDFLFEQDGLLY